MGERQRNYLGHQSCEGTSNGAAWNDVLTPKVTKNATKNGQELCSKHATIQNNKKSHKIAYTDIEM